MSVCAIQAQNGKTTLSLRLKHDVSAFLLRYSTQSIIDYPALGTKRSCIVLGSVNREPDLKEQDDVVNDATLVDG